MREATESADTILRGLSTQTNRQGDTIMQFETIIDRFRESSVALFMEMDLAAQSRQMDVVEQMGRGLSDVKAQMSNEVSNSSPSSARSLPEHSCRTISEV